MQIYKILVSSITRKKDSKNCQFFTYFKRNTSLKSSRYRHDSNVTTEFYITAKTQKLQLWIMFVSVSLGLILLCVVIIILNMVSPSHIIIMSLLFF